MSYFVFEHRRNGKLLHRETAKNLAVGEGLQYVGQTTHGTRTRLLAWQFGLIDNAGFTSLSHSDTASSHPGWSEFTTVAERQTWQLNQNAVNGQYTESSVLNDAVFTISKSGGIKGAFLIGSWISLQTLFATVLLGAVLTVRPGDELTVRYTLTAEQG